MTSRPAADHIREAACPPTPCAESGKRRYEYRGRCLANNPHTARRLLNLALTLLSLSVIASGCYSTSKRAETPPGGAAASAQNSRPQIKIYIDEALLKKPHAILSGTVENSGAETLSNLVVEVELKRRGGDERERREAAVTPQNLAPGEKGRYVLKVISEEWGDFRVVGLKSSGRPDGVAFISLPGAQRPPERFDGTRTVTVEGSRKANRGSNDDFINTPDTPIAVP